MFFRLRQKFFTQLKKTPQYELLVAVVFEPTVCYCQCSCPSKVSSIFLYHDGSVCLRAQCISAKQLAAFSMQGLLGSFSQPRAPILWCYAAQEFDRFFGVNVSLAFPGEHFSTLCSHSLLALLCSSYGAEVCKS